MPAAKSKKASVKAQAEIMIHDLPDSASWDDLMYQIYVRQKIDSGLADIKAGRTHKHAAIKKEFAIVS